MASKEDILERRLGNYAYRFGGSVTVDLFCSMDEYAESKAIEFAKWLSGKGYQQYDESNRWISQQETGNKVFTTKQLYKKFFS